MNPIKLEFRKGTSAKFWQVSVEGAKQVVRYGRIGTEGRETTKSFAGPSQAKAASEKLANSKRKKGYINAGKSMATKSSSGKAVSKAKKGTAATKSAKGAANKASRGSGIKGRIAARVQEITEWLTKNPPEEFPDEVECWKEKKPASEAAIKKAEKTLGHALPADFKAYLSIHNGTPADVVWGELHQVQDLPQKSKWLLGMLGDDEVEQAHKVDARIKPVEFSASWIVIGTSARNRDHLCIDLDPDKGGTKGQIILVSVDSGGAHDWLAESFEDFLDYHLRGHLQGKRKEPKAKRRLEKKKAKKTGAAKPTGSREGASKTKVPSLPPAEAYVPLPRNAQHEKLLSGWERKHVKQWGDWLKKQGHPLAELVHADLKAEKEPPQQEMHKKRALELFQQYVDGYFRPRYRGLAEHMVHFTQEDSRYFGFRYGLLDNLHNFRLQSKGQVKQLREFMKDPHAIFARHVVLRKFTITDLEFLSQFRAVRELKLDWSNLKKLRSIEPVANMKLLRSVSIEGSAVRGISPLAKVPVIQVCLDSTPITSIQSLSGHKTLQHIMLSDTAVRSVNSLMSCKNLCSVDLYCTLVTDSDAEALDRHIRKNKARPSRDEHLMHRIDKDGVFHMQASSKTDLARIRRRCQI